MLEYSWEAERLSASQGFSYMELVSEWVSESVSQSVSTRFFSPLYKYQVHL
jgi:hypothetical protein